MTAVSAALSGGFTADPHHSSFEAELRHMGVGTFRTSFGAVEARLEPRLYGGQRLVGVAQVESIAIRWPKEFRAHVVEGEDFFDARRFPELRFASDELHFGSGGTVRVEGRLMMRGVERPVSAAGTYREPVEDIYGAHRAAIDLETTIDRRDWGFDFQAQLPSGGDVLSWEVQLAIHLELVAD